MAVGRINGYFYKKMYGRFSGQEKSDRNNEVTVLTGWPQGGVPLYYYYNYY